MTEQRYKRTYTAREGNYPSGWRVVSEEDIANAVGQISEYLKKIEKQIPKLIIPLDVRLEERGFSRVYHFGGNTVTENDIDSAATLIFDAGSKQGLTALLRRAELMVFESQENKKKLIFEEV